MLVSNSVKSIRDVRHESRNVADMRRRQRLTHRLVRHILDADFFSTDFCGSHDDDGLAGRLLHQGRGHMNRTRLIPRVTARCILLTGITGFGVSMSCWAAQPYLDDANQDGATQTALVVDGVPTTQQHGYPRFYAHENFGGLSAQALSRYQFVVVHGIHLDTVDAITGFAPDTMVLRHISGRAYQGFTQTDPCHISMSVGFAGTGSVSQGGPEGNGCNIFAGHWLYKAGSRLSAPATSGSLTLQVEDAGRFAAGQFVVIYDSPAGSFDNAEHAKVTAVNRSTNTLTLQARGYKSAPKAHLAGAIVAQHVTGQGPEGELWAFNTTSQSPKDGAGKDIRPVSTPTGSRRTTSGTRMAYWTTANVVGILFDSDFYFELTPNATRCQQRSLHGQRL